MGLSDLRAEDYPDRESGLAHALSALTRADGVDRVIDAHSLSELGLSDS